MGEVEEEQRSLLERGGEGGRSSKKDLLLPHTAADIVQTQDSNLLLLRFLALTPSNPNLPEHHRSDSPIKPETEN